MNTVQSTLDSYLSGPRPRKLEIGAGPNRKAGWLAADIEDYSSRIGASFIHLDAARPFPIDGNVFDLIFCEHMIEHIPFHDGQKMLKECYRILRPEGIIRMVTPSLGFLLRIMSPDRGLVQRAYFEWSIKTFVPDAPALTNAFFLNNFVRNWGHAFIYDHQTMRIAMERAGFTNIKECHVGQSEHPHLNNLESVGRLPPGFLALESMVFEASK